MAIEAIIELEIEGLDKLSALEARLDAIRNNPLNAGFGGGGSQPPSSSTPSSAGGGNFNAQFNAQFNQANQSFSTLNRNLNILNQVTMNYTISQRRLTDQIRTQTNLLGDFGKGLTNITRSLWGLGAHTAKVVTGFTKLGALFTGTGMLAGLAYLINSSKQITERSFGANAYGVNPNDVSRLSATYGRLANVESVLGSVTEQANAPFSMLYTQMGMTQQQAQMMSPEQRFRRVMQQGRQAAMSPYGASELSLQQYGLQGTLSVEDLARMKNMSQRDWESIGQTAEQYKGQTQLREPGAWQEFGMKRSLGMQSLEATAQNLLTPLLAPLNKIFTTVFDKVLGPNVDRKVNIFTKTIDLARTALEKLNEILGADSWQDFWGRVWKAAKDFWEFLKPEAEKAFQSIGTWFKEDFPSMAREAFDRLGSYIDEHFPQLAETTDHVVANLRILGTVIDSLGSLLSRLGIIPAAQATSNVNPTGPGFGGTQSTGSNVNNIGNFPFRPEIMAAAHAHNLNPALVAAVVEQESSFRPNALGSQTRYGKAGGLMQLLPMTAQRFGVRDRFDPGQNTMGGAAYLEFLMNRYGNDESRAVAGFYAGEGNVDKARGQVPKYARSYVDQVLERKRRIEGGMGRSTASGTTYSNAQVRVNVNNNSSAQAEIQVSRMGGASNTTNQ